MNGYLLFIDTEASGLPKKWHLPYSVAGNWPNAVQVSWLIYTKEGKKVGEQSHYICNNDFEIADSALRVHGLTKDFLRQNGIPRKQLLQLLSEDLLKYRPMVVGHFMELDYRVIGADYYREEMDNPMDGLRSFCIMKASEHLQQNPRIKFLRLGDLYELLFKKPLLNQHNAMTDASATAECFFELVKRNEIRSFVQPPIKFPKPEKQVSITPWIIVLLLVVLGVFLIAHYHG